MENILRNAVENRKKYLISKLIQLGVYKENDPDLIELNLSDLENEYKALVANTDTDKMT